MDGASPKLMQNVIEYVGFGFESGENEGHVYLQSFLLKQKF